MLIKTLQDIRKFREQECPHCNLCEPDGICHRMFRVECPECKRQIVTEGESVDDVLHYGCPRCAIQ